jgi:hypothetical protein
MQTEKRLKHVFRVPYKREERNTHIIKRRQRRRPNRVNEDFHYMSEIQHSWLTFSAMHSNW